LFAVDNYGSFGDDNTSDGDDDNSDNYNTNDDNDNDYYYDSGSTSSLVTFPDSDVHYPDFGVPNIGLQFY